MKTLTLNKAMYGFYASFPSFAWVESERWPDGTYWKASSDEGLRLSHVFDSTTHELLSRTDYIALLSKLPPGSSAAEISLDGQSVLFFAQKSSVRSFYLISIV
jgi:hypothetical protein